MANGWLKTSLGCQQMSQNLQKVAQKTWFDCQQGLKTWPGDQHLVQRLACLLTDDSNI